MFRNAASDTSSGTMTFILWFLLKNPQAYKRLSTEIRSTFHSTDTLSNRELQKLPFLDGCINEALRLRPPVPSNFIRETPLEGMLINNLFIPGGTVVSTPAYALMHDSRYWSNPEDFIPERWIENERGNETCTKAAWVPFSYGSRVCIGQSLAIMELRLIVATLLLNFDVECLEENPKEPDWSGVGARGPLPVRMIPIKRES